MNLHTQRQAELKAARDIVDRAKAEGRTATTDPHHSQVNAHLAKADALEQQTKAAAESAALFNLLDGLGGDGSPGRKRFDAKAALANTATEIGAKALAPSGSVVAPAAVVAADPIPLGRVAQGFLGVIATEQSGPVYAYMRQTTRQNNAAAVASGGTKPTSIYTLERKEDRLRVVAHMSEPVDKYWLEDRSSLRSFLTDELAYGLNLAVENILLNGDGIGETPTGILNTSGIQTQAFSTDGYETLRKALTKVQVVGGTEPIIGLHPADYEALDLLRDNNNAFLGTAANRQTVQGGAVAVPTGSSALLAWGVPVVLSNALPAGTGTVLSRDSVRLHTDGRVMVEWNPFAGFNKNQVEARCEGRFGVAVEKPLSVVEVAMTAV